MKGILRRRTKRPPTIGTLHPIVELPESNVNRNFEMPGWIEKKY